MHKHQRLTDSWINKTMKWCACSCITVTVWGQCVWLTGHFRSWWRSVWVGKERKESVKDLVSRMVCRRELANQVYNINLRLLASEIMCRKKEKRVVKQMWLREITVQWQSLNGSFLPCSVHYSQNKSKRTSISALACCAALLPGWLLNDLSNTQSPDCRFTSHTVKQRRETVSASSSGGKSRGVPHFWGWAIVLKWLLQYQKVPHGVFL